MEKLTEYEKELIRQGEEDFKNGRWVNSDDVKVELDEMISTT